MDVFFYLEKWEVKLDEVFSHAPVSEQSNDLTSSFKKLNHIFEKKVKTWWDIASFKQYLSSNLIPRRLRWDIPPNDGLYDEASMIEWRDFFVKKGSELIQLLLSRKERKMEFLESQIRDIRNTIEPFKNSEEFF